MTLLSKAVDDISKTLKQEIETELEKAWTQNIPVIEAQGKQKFKIV